MITMDDDIPNTRCCRVRGDCIQCPFHNWRFSGETGRCVEAAYSSARLPDQARLGVRTSLERNGLVLVWHHAGDAVQCYSVPRVVTSYLPAQTESRPAGGRRCWRRWSPGSGCTRAGTSSRSTATSR